MDHDPDAHVPTLGAAIGKIADRADVDPDRLGLIGFSLGAATAMTYIACNPPGKVKVLADFFGFLTPTIRAGLGNFPPTIIFHNKDDQIVSVRYSQELDRLLPSTVEHERSGHTRGIGKSAITLFHRVALPMWIPGRERKAGSSRTSPRTEGRSARKTSLDGDGARGALPTWTAA